MQRTKIEIFFWGNEQDIVEYLLNSCQSYAFPTEKGESCMLY